MITFNTSSFILALLVLCKLLLLQMMEVLRDGCELVFLYQLVNGHSNSSFACHIASVAGLPQEIVDRGSEVCSVFWYNNKLSV